LSLCVLEQLDAQSGASFIWWIGFSEDDAKVGAEAAIFLPTR